jgi:L-asparaginase II
VTRAAVLALVKRNGTVDSRHWGHIVVAESTGRWLAVGDATTPVFARTSAHALHCLLLISSGAAQRFGLESSELAALTGSHPGSLLHTGLVRQVLAKGGIGPDDLAGHLTSSLDLEGMLTPGPGDAPDLAGCAGKHAAFLLLCRYLGYPFQGYWRPGHPVQRLVRERLAAEAGLPARRLAVGLAGCGLPIYALPLQNLARFYARLASPGQTAVQTLQMAVGRHPYLALPNQPLLAHLVEVTQGRILPLVAREGLCGLVVPGQGIGIAIKVDDGSPRALLAVVPEVLRQLGLLSAGEQTALAERTSPYIHSGRGEILGMVQAAFQLTPDPASARTTASAGVRQPG